MNKKFFSAVLMGALLLGGTFVSCQDYDDDIDNLQEQIDKLASADQLSSKVSELQSAISAAQSAAEAKAAAANTVAEAAKKAAGDADAKAAAAQKAADDVKAAAGNYATKEEATAAANAAQKVANDLKEALDGALTEEAMNAAIKAELEKALAKYATTEALAELSAKLDELQAAIEKAVTPEQLKELADKIDAIKEAGIPGVPTAVASVSAPAPKVNVARTWAQWSEAKHNVAGSASADRFEVLAEQFPDIKEIKDGALQEQGGWLPVIVNPSNVDLADHSVALQTLEGIADGVTISEAKEGLVDAYEFNEAGIVMSTRATAEDCIWSLKVVPAKNKYGKDLDVANAAIVIEEGEVALKTPFAYSYKSTKAGDVKVKNVAKEAKCVDGAVKVVPGVFAIENGKSNIFVLSLDAADKDRYGVEVKDGKFEIAKFPANASEITLRDIKVIALGLNGSTAEGKLAALKVTKATDLVGELTPDTINLDFAKTNKASWTVADLVALNNLTADVKEDIINAITADKAKAVVLRDGVVQKFTVDGAKKDSIPVVAYDKNGKALAANASYKNAVTFGFDFAATELPPYEYEVQIVFGDVFGANTSIVTLYTTNVISLYEDLCKNGVLQFTGDVETIDKTLEFTEGTVSYDMAKGLKHGSDVTVVGIVDLDEEWEVDGTIITAPKTSVNVATPHNLTALYTVDGVYEYGTDGKPLKKVGTTTDSLAVQEYNFQADLVSPIWSANPVEKVVFNYVANKDLSATFNSDDNTIDVKAQIKEGLYTAGYNRGKPYSFFKSGGSAKVNGGVQTKQFTDYSKPDSLTNLTGSGDIYIKDKDGKIYVENDLNYIIPFGWDGSDYDYDSDSHSIKLTKRMYNAGMATMNKYFVQNDTTGAKENIYLLVWKTKNADGTFSYDVNTALNNRVYYQAISDSAHVAATTADPIYGQSIVKNGSANLEVRMVDPSKTTIEQYLIQKVGSDWYYSDNKGQAWTKLAAENKYSDTAGKGWSVEKKEDLALNYTGVTDALQTIVDKPNTANLVALEALTIKYCNNLMTKLGFSTKKTVKIYKAEKAAVAPALTCPELVKEPTFSFAKPETADKYATISAGVVTVRELNIEDVPAQKVVLDVNMTVEDWWGKTMVITIPVTINTK